VNEDLDPACVDKVSCDQLLRDADGNLISTSHFPAQVSLNSDVTKVCMVLTVGDTIIATDCEEINYILCECVLGKIGLSLTFFNHI